ncbi:unnamed protein product [Taenia asiatica]|uniref:DUF4604 domain-containing protein n=1 Tax=Taenia asiatica TaxID=60517 RepID=A0A0R3W673_TAEAS|nr:unnamed protein product [Taenia asiatica]
MQSEGALRPLFARILGNYIKIKKFETVSTDNKFKELVQESCAICQEAIQMINQLELFSKNESLEDLSTQSIRYLTLPAFLAFFNGQKSDREERLNALKLAQAYYDEFMDLVECYGIPDLPKRLTAHDSSGDSANLKSKTSVVRRDPNVVREEKIRAYKAKKALEQRLENFLSFDSPHTDDEVLVSDPFSFFGLVYIKRDESVAFVRYWAYTAVEELKLIDEEVAILSRFPGPQGPSSPSPPPIIRQPPLLITREKIRAAVFGAGYPSLPTMTLDQFVELQVQQGLMPPPQSVKDNKSNSREGTWRRINPSETAEAKQETETRAAREDALEDAYSEEQRTKARNFDEFKDEHRLFDETDIFSLPSPSEPPVFSQQRAQPRRSGDDDDDLRDREDEAPQVVAGTGVSESEAIDFARRNLVKKQPQKNKLDAENDDKSTAEEIEAERSGRVLFRKPRAKEDSKETKARKATNRKKGENERTKKTAIERKDKKSGGGLSFSYDDAEEEDD